MVQGLCLRPKLAITFYGYQQSLCVLARRDGKVLVRGIAGNALGFGKFTFTPEKDMRYSLRVELKNGASMEKKLPESVGKGVLLSVSTVQPEKCPR